MKTPFKKSAALLGSALLAVTLSACGADDDTSPVPEEPSTEQFDGFEDEANQPDQSGTPLDEDGAPGTSEGEDPDTNPNEDETDDMGPRNEETDDNDERDPQDN
ncbi:hypothetical protein [Enteractinococcus coprophilus]|uniref:Uncharacterized protein n=1 Tax=Enteractinococcus coprophilus TaxID=1027633 RepID=A0A543AGA9_9MICC|nr:hypothetical protein [Enteractinococcus coprophilus]TQL71610.1 hypothetical protein FB556_2098 [Enteractinococcus coprophilus]